MHIKSLLQIVTGIATPVTEVTVRNNMYWINDLQNLNYSGNSQERKFSNMLNNLFQQGDVQEHITNIIKSICNTCNNCNNLSKSNDIEELSPSEVATENLDVAVTPVTTEVQLNLKETSQKKAMLDSTPEKCWWCGSTDFWQGVSGKVCRRCHPPAPGAEIFTDKNGGE